MICFLKSHKNQPPKTTSIDKAFARPERPAKVEPASWMPLTAGPYLVPVTRWIE
jgi:hypothetical protein